MSYVNFMTMMMVVVVVMMITTAETAAEEEEEITVKTSERLSSIYGETEQSREEQCNSAQLITAPFPSLFAFRTIL